MMILRSPWLTILAICSLCSCSSSSNEVAVNPDAGLPDTSIAADSRASDVQPGPDQNVGVPPPTEADWTRLKEMLKTLADPSVMRGRLIGSPSGAKAEAYVLERMNASGLEVKTQDVTLPIFDLQTPIDLSIVDEQGLPVKTLKYISEYREVAFCGSGSVSAALHFVGYGEESSYKDQDVTGKIVAVLTTPSGATRRAQLDDKIKLAYDKGAAAVIFIPSGLDAGDDTAIGNQLQPQALHEYGVIDSALIAKNLPSVWVHLGNEVALLGKTATDLVADPKPFDAKKLVHVEVHGTIYPQAVCKNVIGIARGTDPVLKDEVIVVGAHYDHIGQAGDGTIFPGAADNASGSATVMEMAFSLGKVKAPKRTLVFALFCGEDQYLYGSMHYTKKPVFPLAQTILDVNVDYIGDTEGPYWLRDKKVALQDQFISASADNPVKEMKVSAFQCGSDECPFQMAGIPFIRFLSMGQHHHQPTDTYENLNLSNVEKVAHAIIRGLVKLAY